MDDATLSRAAGRWGKFFGGLTRDECQLLDRVALGDSLKNVCFDLGLTYDTMQKRMCRWQQALALPSTPTFLHFWMTVRNLGRAVGDPTMLRYVEILRAKLGYVPDLMLPPPDDLANSAWTILQTWQPYPSAATTARALGSELTLAVLSPAIWHALLEIALDGAWDPETRVGVPVQHQLFRGTVGLAGPGTSPHRTAMLVRSALELSEDRALERRTHRAPWLRPSLFVQTMQSRHTVLRHGLGIAVAMPGAIEMPCNEGFSRREDYQFWLRFVGHAVNEAPEPVEQLVNSLHAEIIFGPLTGLCLAIAFFNASTSRLRASVSRSINQIISNRVQLAQSLGIHPLRLVAHLSQVESGVGVAGQPYRLAQGEVLEALSAEQLLPEVRDIVAGTDPPQPSPRGGRPRHARQSGTPQS